MQVLVQYVWVESEILGASNELFIGIAAAWNHVSTLGEAGFSLEALVVRWADEGPEQRSGPQHTASQHQSPVSGVTDKAVNMLISQILGSGALWSYPAVPDAAIVFRGAGGGHALGALQSSETSHQLSEVWTLGRGTRGQMEVEGPVVVALRLQRVPWVNLFVLDLTPQSSHSDSLRSCVFSCSSLVPLRVAGSVTVSSLPLPS